MSQTLRFFFGADLPVGKPRPKIPDNPVSMIGLSVEFTTAKAWASTAIPATATASFEMVPFAEDPVVESPYDIEMDGPTDILV